MYMLKAFFQQSMSTLADRLSILLLSTLDTSRSFGGEWRCKRVCLPELSYALWQSLT